ncbi:hypothetical protein L208DRAFT_1378106 [Tricholoma matsutake]|nr:hypothetical protein L208DRAFT_1378106 [Tricholoma matsutake 945]
MDEFWEAWDKYNDESLDCEIENNPDGKKGNECSDQPLESEYHLWWGLEGEGEFSVCLHAIVAHGTNLEVFPDFSRLPGYTSDDVEWAKPNDAQDHDQDTEESESDPHDDSRAQLALLRQISWTSNAILGTEDVEEPGWQCPQLLPLQQCILQAEIELSGHSKDMQIVRRLLQVDDAADSDIGDLNNALIGRALRRLVVYHVYDILFTIEKALHSVQTLSNTMSNPPSVSSGSSMGVGGSNVTASLMMSVLALKTQTQGEKILCNIQTACMDIDALKQGCWDFTENKGLMEAMSLHKEYVPSVSPLSLILPKLLWGQRSNQTIFTTAFPAYSSSKPKSLEAIEGVLWKAIVAIVQAEKEPILAILEALTIMQNMASVVSDEDAAWFSSEYSHGHWMYGSQLLEPVIDVGVGQLANTTSGSTLPQMVGPDPNPPAGMDSMIVDTVALPDLHLGGDDGSAAAGQLAPTNDPTLPQMVGPDPNLPAGMDSMIIDTVALPDSHLGGDDRSAAAGQLAPTNDLTLPQMTRSDLYPPNTIEDTLDLEGQLLAASNKTAELGSITNTMQDPPPPIPWVICPADSEETSNCNPRCTTPAAPQDIEASTLCRSICKKTHTDAHQHTTTQASTQHTKRQRQSTQSCTVAQPGAKPVALLPHSINLKDPKPTVISEHLLIRVIPMTVNQPELGNYSSLLHLTTPRGHERVAVDQVFSLHSVDGNVDMQYSPAFHISTRFEQYMVQSSYKFDEDGLAEFFGMPGCVVMINGTHSSAQHAWGTLDNLLESAHATNGNIMTTTPIPSPLIDTPVAATLDSLSPWRIGSEGTFTYLDIMVGSLWVVVAVQKEGDIDGFASTRLHSHMSSTAPNSELWDMQGIVLVAGNRIFIRPNTPYCMLALANMIYCGGGFYSMSCMMESCTGIMQDFVRCAIHQKASLPLQDNLYQEDDHSGAYMLLLEWIITYLHNMYIVHKANSTTDPDIDNPHLGDSKSILAVCAIVELANVLHSNMYCPNGVSPEERLIMICTHKLARTIVQKTMDFRDDSGNSGITLIQGHAVYMASMLLEAMEACVHDGFKLAIPLDTIKSQLDGCFGTGRSTCITIKGHSFIRQFNLKRAPPRMTITLSGVHGKTADEDLWLRQQGFKCMLNLSIKKLEEKIKWSWCDLACVQSPSLLGAQIQNIEEV